AQMPIQNVQNQREASDDGLDEERDELENAGQRSAAQHGAGQSGGGRTEQGNHQNNPGPDPDRQGNGGRHYGDCDYSRQPAFVAEAGSGPQPEIEGMPAEVALTPEAAGEGNGSRERHFNGGNGDGRRSRRPRRGERNRPDANNDGEPASDGLAATL